MMALTHFYGERCIPLHSQSASANRKPTIIHYLNFTAIACDSLHRHNTFLDTETQAQIIMFKRGAKATDPSKRFKLGECLGKGAFASVYRATDKSTKTPCAVKKMTLTGAPAGAQPMTEYEIGRAVNHDNVVKTLDW